MSENMSKRTDPAVVEIFSALGDETRLALIVKLRAGFLSATTLSDGAPVTRQAILKHLNVLESEIRPAEVSALEELGGTKRRCRTPKPSSQGSATQPFGAHDTR